MEGKLLLMDEASAEAYYFKTDLSHLNAGIYMLRLRHSDGEQEVFKLVKQ